MFGAMRNFGRMGAVGANVLSWLPLADGTKPTLYANFASGASGAQYWANGAVDSTAAAWLSALSGTYTNSTGKYVYGSNGLLTSVAANTLPFDYDPVTLACNGLLLEGAGTNLLLNSSASGTNLATQNVTVTAQAYTLSFWGTGTITLSGAYTGSLVGSGVFPTRSQVSFTPTAGTLTLTVSGTVQYAQFETGLFATSFIPTTSTTATRAADSVTWPFAATTATILVTAGDILNPTSQPSLVASSSASNTFIQLAGPSRIQNWDGTHGTYYGTSGNFSGVSYDTGFPKAAFAYGGGASAMTANGGVPAAGVNSFSPTTMFLGTSNTFPVFGNIKQIGTWNGLFASNAALQSLTQ